MSRFTSDSAVPRTRSPRVTYCKCPIVFKILSVGLALLLAGETPALLAAEADSGLQSSDGEWTIRILPLSKAPRKKAAADETAAAEETVDDSAVAMATLQEGTNEAPSQAAASEAPAGSIRIMPKPMMPKSYASIYHSIPFSRSAYNADPAYRHDAAMELLTGNPRPSKVYNYHYETPAAPYPWWAGNSYFWPRYDYYRDYDLSRGPYSRYRSLFGYTGGYRKKFYLYGTP